LTQCPLVRTQLDYDDDEHEVNWHKKLFAGHFNLDRHMETKLKWKMLKIIIIIIIIIGYTLNNFTTHITIL
jgi:hypothetical protein